MWVLTWWRFAWQTPLPNLRLLSVSSTYVNCSNRFCFMHLRIDLNFIDHFILIPFIWCFFLLHLANGNVSFHRKPQFMHAKFMYNFNPIRLLQRTWKKWWQMWSIFPGRTNRGKFPQKISQIVVCSLWKWKHLCVQPFLRNISKYYDDVFTPIMKNLVAQLDPIYVQAKRQPLPTHCSEGKGSRWANFNGSARKILEYTTPRYWTAHPQPQLSVACWCFIKKILGVSMWTFRPCVLKLSSMFISTQCSFE